MRKLRLKDSVKNTIAIITFFVIIIGGVMLIDARIENINNQNKIVEKN